MGKGFEDKYVEYDVSRGKQRINGDTMKRNRLNVSAYRCPYLSMARRSSSSPKYSERCSAIGISMKENVPERHPGRFLSFRIRTRHQCETAANSGECIRAWNFSSSLLKWSCRFELSESTVVASRAVFSAGLALSFL